LQKTDGENLVKKDGRRKLWKKNNQKREETLFKPLSQAKNGSPLFPGKKKKRGGGKRKKKRGGEQQEPHSKPSGKRRWFGQRAIIEPWGEKERGKQRKGGEKSTKGGRPLAKFDKKRNTTGEIGEKRSSVSQKGKKKRRKSSKRASLHKGGKVFFGKKRASGKFGGGKKKKNCWCPLSKKRIS